MDSTYPILLLPLYLQLIKKTAQSGAVNIYQVTELDDCHDPRIALSAFSMILLSGLWLDIISLI
jgi:hypothetical protein